MAVKFMERFKKMFLQFENTSPLASVVQENACNTILL